MGKYTKRSILVGAALALTVGGGVACLATAGADSADRPKEATGAEYVRVSEWAAEYPTQYESFAQYQVRENVKHGHYGIGMRLLAPVDRQAYDAVPVSTNFNQDENGLYKISGFHYDQATEQWVIDDDVSTRASARAASRASRPIPTCSSRRRAPRLSAPSSTASSSMP